MSPESMKFNLIPHRYKKDRMISFLFDPFFHDIIVFVQILGLRNFADYRFNRTCRIFATYETYISYAHEQNAICTEI